jgi:Fe-S cluster assembly protein SufD
MTVTTDADILASAVRVGEAHDEPAWLRGLRARAAEVYAAAPLPSRATHLWRFTPPEPFLTAAGAPGPGVRDGTGGEPAWPDAIAEAWSRGALAGAAWLRGPDLAKAVLGDAAGRAGVMLASLHDAAARHSGLVQPYLGTLVDPDFGKFEALNAAVWDGGIFLYVPGGVRLDAPVHLLRDVGPGTVSRLLIVAEDGAAVTVIEEIGGGSGPASVSHGVVEIVAGAESDVRCVTVQRLDATAVAHETRRAGLRTDARFLHVHAALGAGLAKANLGAVLAGRGAEARFAGIAVADGSQQFDHHTAHDHLGPDTRSDLHFRVVLRGRARSIYTGRIRVEKEAVNTDAYQENRNLLLDDGTKAESIPELEILTDAVRCTHGATMGPVDPEQVLYLQSRGIPRPDAERLIVAGFVEPALDKMPADLRGRVRRAVADKLGLPPAEETDGE